MSDTLTLSKLWQAVKQSLDGEEQDYTVGSIRKAVFLLAIPMILELILESVFAVVDIFFVSKLGENAIATVGLTESVTTLIYSVGIGVSTAATAIVARRVGEKNAAAAGKAAAQAIIIGVFISILISIPGFYFASDILQFMGAAPEVVRDGAIFTRIMLGSSLVIVMLFLINGIFRGAGQAAMAMKSLWLASILNIILCPIFIHIWGLKGAAIATLIGRGSGILYQCYFLWKGSNSMKVKLSDFSIDWTGIVAIVKIAWPATFQFFIASGSWVILSRLVAETGGTTATAGYQIAMRNVVFFILPAWGLSNAAATLVGQNLGAGKIDRAEQSVMIATKYNAIFMAGVMCLFLFFSKAILGLFTSDTAIIAHGALALQIIGAGYIFYGIGMVMTQALNGAGDTSTPTMINIVGFWLFQIPLAYLLAHYFKLNELGAFIAIPVAETFIALLAWYYFYKGKWKLVKV